MHFIITCDGGSRNNQFADKREGYGSYMIHPARQSAKTVKRLQFGKGVTNNEAEYMSLIAALEHLTSALESVASNLGKVDVTVRTDSQLVVGQLGQGQKVKASNLKPLVGRANDLLRRYNYIKFEQISGDEMKEILGH